MRTRLVTFAIALAVVLGVPYLARAANETVFWPGLYLVALGQPVHRATVTVASGSPRDNTITDGGAPVTYTFGGGEHVCLEGSSAFCFEVTAAASMTASCAKAVSVPANTSRCFFLRQGATKVAVDATSGSPTVRMHETVWP